MSQEFRREYLLRLPLPLAQLYSRAFNAKDARGRHDNAFYLCEALVKLAAALGGGGHTLSVRRGDKELEFRVAPWPVGYSDAGRLLPAPASPDGKPDVGGK